MIGRGLALAAVLGTASCYNDLHYYGEEWSMNYQHPRDETSRRRVDSKEIVYWASNPKDKVRIGFYETWEVKLEGSRGSRECHYIKDSGGLKTIGFVTNEGVFFRFPEGSSTPQRLNEYQILTIGLKVFFGIPNHENVDLEDIDPYRMARPPALPNSRSEAPAAPAAPAAKPPAEK
ncbi:MAG TPA: hypothetical protein VEN81_01165 [Planctomycetota bacterium]|nr:hypothetical protein [Planctomycetota bacterium]